MAKQPLRFNPKRWVLTGEELLKFRRGLRDVLLDEMSVIRLCYVPRYYSSKFRKPSNDYKAAWEAAVVMIRQLMETTPRNYTQYIPGVPKMGRLPENVAVDYVRSFEPPEKYLPPKVLKQTPDVRRRPGGQARKRL